MDAFDPLGGGESNDAEPNYDCPQQTSGLAFSLNPAQFLAL
jgi:hypothetical protein